MGWKDTKLYLSSHQFFDDGCNFWKPNTRVDIWNERAFKISLEKNCGWLFKKYRTERISCSHISYVYSGQRRIFFKKTAKLLFSSNFSVYKIVKIPLHFTLFFVPGCTQLDLSEYYHHIITAKPDLDFVLQEWKLVSTVLKKPNPYRYANEVIITQVICIFRSKRKPKVNSLEKKINRHFINESKK